MASSRLPGPIGFTPASTDRNRTRSGWFPSWPGNLAKANRAQDAGQVTVASTWIDFDIDKLGATVKHDAVAGTAIRLASVDESDSGYARIEFATLEQASIAATRLLASPALATQLRERSGSGSNQLIDWTTQQLHVEALKVLWRQRTPVVVSIEPPAPPTAPPRPAPAWTPPPAPAPAYATFPPDFDAEAVAQALVDAARDGIPFCEECKNAAADSRIDLQFGTIQ